MHGKATPTQVSVCETTTSTSAVCVCVCVRARTPKVGVQGAMVRTSIGTSQSGKQQQHATPTTFTDQLMVCPCTLRPWQCSRQAEVPFCTTLSFNLATNVLRLLPGSSTIILTTTAGMSCLRAETSARAFCVAISPFTCAT